MRVVNLLSSNTVLPWVLLAAIAGILLCVIAIFYTIWKRENIILTDSNAFLNNVLLVLERKNEKESAFTREIEKISHKKYLEKMAQAKEKIEKLAMEVAVVEDLQLRLENAEIEKKVLDEKRLLLEQDIAELKMGESARLKLTIKELLKKTDEYCNLLSQADLREVELLKALGSIRKLLIKAIGAESAEYLNEEIRKALIEIEQVLKNF